jgi:hypothetical protein
MVKACLAAENTSILLHVTCTKKKIFKKRKMLRDEIPYEASVYGDRETAAEESFRRNAIYTDLCFIICDLANRLEA